MIHTTSMLYKAAHTHTHTKWDNTKSKRFLQYTTCTWHWPLDSGSGGGKVIEGGGGWVGGRGGGACEGTGGGGLKPATSSYSSWSSSSSGPIGALVMEKE